MKTLFIGDVVGKPGRRVLREHLPRMVQSHKADFVIVNGENSAGGVGITEDAAAEMFDLGVDILTSGNHVWDKRGSIPYIADDRRILRPFNYPPGVPGRGLGVFELPGGGAVGVINLQGRVFMPTIDCPFRAVDEALKELSATDENPQVVIVDVHAEATSEKVALALYLDSRVSAVVGTHTHVQTADETILPGGTAYITDVGMTGPVDSVIGVKKEQVIERFLLQMPTRFEVASGRTMLNAVVLDIENSTGRARSIERIFLKSN